MTQDKKAYLVFKLGHLQVFYYQTLEDLHKKIQPTEFFWKKVDDNEIHGPFKTTHDAVNHYSEAIAPKPELPANVIPVDFKAKKRIK